MHGIGTQKATWQQSGGVVTLRLRGLEKACPEKGSGAPALEDEKEPPNREKEKGLHIQSSRYRELWKLWT